MMKIWATLAVAVGLVAGGFPHSCHCRCAKAAETPAAAQGAAPTCPHCRPEKSEPAPMPNPPRPCKCGTCGTVIAAVVGSPTMAPSPDSAWRVQFAPVVLHVQPLVSPASTTGSRTEPPGMAAPSGCALPILLGHLLF